MKKNIVKISMILLYIFSIISCEKKHKNTQVNSFKFVIDNNLGEKLLIPDSLELYHPFTVINNNKKVLNSKLKIYTHIDASCGTCIETLKAWNNLIPEINREGVQVILICSSDNKFELLKFYFESKEIKNFSHPLFLDHKNNFMEKNRFMSESKNFETVLTDKNDKILLIGNPNFSNKIKELYFKEIKKHQIK
tara:strand:+ start:2212 stop:2790 length:579 start_codon:yes stop_codon:yes gene_type:complete